MRLDKLIERQLQTSRKQMKRLFLMGKVQVDGETVYQENKNVDSSIHTIQVDNQTLLTDDRYYLLNKPSGVVTANQDRLPTVFNQLRVEDRRVDLSAVGRLDRDTEGLLLLTSNGQLGYDLLQPKKKVTKVYEAIINAEVTAEDVTLFGEGITFHGGESCQPAKLEILSRKLEESYVRLTIREGKYHQVKKMFLATGKKVIYLRRVAMGPLTLGELPTGTYRPLTQEELLQLKPYFR
ncbi:16S rRNA pseudouridine(516) synthase [Enterococcus olivae]